MSGVFLYRVLPTFWDSLSHGICSFLPELHWLASELSPQDPSLSIPTLNAGATQVYAQLSWVLAILTQILVLAQQSFLYNELYLPTPNSVFKGGTRMVFIIFLFFSSKYALKFHQFPYHLHICNVSTDGLNLTSPVYICSCFTNMPGKEMAEVSIAEILRKVYSALVSRIPHSYAALLPYHEGSWGTLQNIKKFTWKIACHHERQSR